MSEQKTPNDHPQGEVPKGDQDQLGDGGKKAIAAEREARKAAEKQAADLQAQLDKINRANESAMEKAQREAQEAAAARDQALADALRYRIQARFAVSDEDADLFLTGADEATLTRQAQRLTERTAPTPEPEKAPGPRPDLSQAGGKGNPPALNSDALTDALSAAVGAK